jgi:hypothetical protein
MTPSDRALVMTKHHANRWIFGGLLAFFRDHGRFPRIAAEVCRLIVEEIARQLAIGVLDDFSASCGNEPRNGTAPKSGRR